MTKLLFASKALPQIITMNFLTSAEWLHGTQGIWPFHPRSRVTQIAPGNDHGQTSVLQTFEKNSAKPMTWSEERSSAPKCFKWLSKVAQISAFFSRMSMKKNETNTFLWQQVEWKTSNNQPLLKHPRGLCFTKAFRKRWISASVNSSLTDLGQQKVGGKCNPLPLGQIGCLIPVLACFSLYFGKSQALRAGTWSWALRTCYWQKGYGTKIHNRGSFYKKMCLLYNS